MLIVCTGWKAIFLFLLLLMCCASTACITVLDAQVGMIKAFTVHCTVYRLHRYTVPPSLSCTPTSIGTAATINLASPSPRLVPLPCPYLRRRQCGHRCSPRPRFYYGPPGSTGPEMEFLDIKFNKRIEFFAPCYYSQSLLLAGFKENLALLWF
jgi:hypothetical protein